MVHATRIRDGVASYCNHWVRTHKLAEEQRAGFPIYAKVRVAEVVWVLVFWLRRECVE
jgi:carotenoid cleavage dioxygenase-like enzyme